jgi:hypothetical protein
MAGKKTELQEVTLVGTYRGGNVLAVWRRVEGGWDVLIKTADRHHTFEIRMREMPCWSVTLRLIEQMPANQRAKPTRITAKRAVTVAKYGVW